MRLLNRSRLALWAVALPFALIVLFAGSRDVYWSGDFYLEVYPAYLALQHGFVDRFFDLAGLYERLSADAAHKIIESVRGREPVRARRPAHRAMYYDDEAARSRRGAAPRRLGVSAEPQAPARTETGKTQRTM